MTKRIFSLVMVFCMMLSMIPAFADTTAAADPCANGHVGLVYINIGDKNVHRVDCATCGKMNLNNIVDGTHQWELQNDGTQICKLCKYDNDELVCDHDKNAWHDNGDGTHSPACSVCGYVAEDAPKTECTKFVHNTGDLSANRVCEVCGGEEDCAHEYEWRVAEGAYAGKGYCLKDCKLCKRREVQPQPHVKVWTKGEDKIADDKADYHYGVCKNCGTSVGEAACNVPTGSTNNEWLYDTAEHWNDCQHCDGRVNIAPHSFGWFEFYVKDENGKNTDEKTYAYGCSVCKYIVSECTDHKGTGLNAATCLQYEICDKCGQVVKEEYAPHAWEANVDMENGYHASYCPVCNTFGPDAEEHSFVLENGKSVCKDCGAANPVACKHPADQIDEVKGYDAICIIGKQVDGVKSQKYCKACETVLELGNEITDPDKAHKLVKSEELKPDCTTTGKYLLKCSVEGCTYTEWEYVTVDDVRAHAAYELKFVETKKAADCDEDGIEIWQCTNCKEKLEVVTKATGHDYTTMICDLDENGNWTDKLDCTDGVYSYTGCKNCHRRLSQPTLIPDSIKLNHRESAGVKVAATCTTVECWKFECLNDYCDIVWYEDAKGNVIDPTEGAADRHDVSKGVIVHVVKPATCYQAGEEWYECPACHAQIAAKGTGAYRHWVTTTQNATIAKLAHSNNKSQLADAEDHNVSDHTVAGWNYVEATCKTLGYWESYCDYCLENYIKVEDTDPDCIGEHVYINGKAIDKEVCGKKAKYEQICKYCGELEKVNGENVVVEDTVEHDYVPNGAPIVEATCSKNGYGALKCTRCGHETYGTIEATDDCVFEYMFVAPDCYNGAKQGWFCVNCGEEKEGTASTPAADSKPLGHDLDDGEIVKLCGFDGTVIKFSCKRGCGYAEYLNTVDNKYITDIDNLEHKEGKDVLVKKTCTVNGLNKLHVCELCDYEFELEDDEFRYEVVPAGHEKPTTGVEEITDCIETYEKFKCTVCNLTVSVKLEGEAGEKKDENNHRSPAYDFSAPGCTPNTCTEDGFGYAICEACGWKADAPAVVKPDHKWSKTPVVTIPATCGTIGYGKVVCEVCGAEKLDEDGLSHLVEIPATGKHTFTRSILDSNSCALESYVVYECSVCGAGAEKKDMDKLGYKYEPIDEFVYLDKDNEEHKILNDTKTEDSLDHVIEVLDYEGKHQYGKAVYMEATCTHGAGMIETCKRCGHMNNLSGTEPLEHDYVETKVAATCYTDGLYMKTCYNCGYVGLKTVLGTTSHNLVEDEDDLRNRAATCSKTGIKVWECVNEGCTYEELEVLPYDEDNHEWETIREFFAADCKTGSTGLAQQQCAKCGVKAVNSISAAHTWEDTAVVKAATCAEEGQMKQTCSVCGKATQIVPIETLPHTLVTFAQEADCINEAGIVTQCSVCKLKTNFLKTGSTALGHQWSSKTHVPATCDAAGGEKIVCLREGCGASYVFVDAEKYPALAHKGKTLVETIPATCVSPVIKVYLCPICEKEIEIKEGKNDKVNGHAWEITAQYAEKITCDAPNYVDRKCSLCNTEQTRVWHTPAHTMSDYVYSKDFVYRFCLVCGAVESIYISGDFDNFDGCTTVEIDENGKAVLKGAHKGLVIKAGKEGTCEVAGQVEHIECTVCGTVIKEGKEIPAHNVTVIPAVAATCTAEGSTEGKYCEDCKTYIVEVKPVAKLAHTPVEVPAKAATATEAGHTAGKKCSVCGEVLEGMEPIAKLTATVKRLCTVRSLPADYRDNTESVVVEMLTADTAINILGVENEYYKVGEGRYIHISYVELAAAVA